MAELYSEPLYGEDTYSQDTFSAPAGAGTYNEIYYNENLYNAAVLVLALFESLTSSDARTIDDLQGTLSEAITMADTLQRYFNGAIFNETLTPTDVILNQAQISKLDIMTLTDAFTATVLKSLLETMTLSDLRTMAQSRQFVESLVLVDILTKFISDKRLNDSLRLQDWLNIKKNPAEQVWGN